MLDLTDTEREVLATVGRYDQGYVTLYGTPEHAIALALEAKRFLKVEAVGPTSYTWKLRQTDGVRATAMTSAAQQRPPAQTSQHER